MEANKRLANTSDAQRFTFTVQSDTAYIKCRTEQAGRQTAKADRNIQQTNIFIGKRKIKESKKINRFHGKYTQTYKWQKIYRPSACCSNCLNQCRLWHCANTLAYRITHTRHESTRIALIIRVQYTHTHSSNHSRRDAHSARKKTPELVRDGMLCIKTDNEC